MWEGGVWEGGEWEGRETGGREGAAVGGKMWVCIAVLRGEIKDCIGTMEG